MLDINVTDRSFLTNLPCIEDPVHASLHDLVRSLNPNLFVEAMPSWARHEYTEEQQREMLTNPKYIAEEMDIKFWYNSDCKLYQAIELMRSCLALDLTKRITAADALNHPFLSVSTFFLSTYMNHADYVYNLDRIVKQSIIKQQDKGILIVSPHKGRPLGRDPSSSLGLYRLLHHSVRLAAAFCMHTGFLFPSFNDLSCHRLMLLLYELNASMHNSCSLLV